MRLGWLGGDPVRCAELTWRLPKVRIVPIVDRATCSAAEALVVAGPHPNAAEIVEQALEQSRPVLWSLDVPLEAERRLDWLTRSAAGEAPFWLDGPERHWPSRQGIIEARAAGKLGDTGLIRKHDWFPTSAPGLEARGLAALDLIERLIGEEPSCGFATAPHNARGNQVQWHWGFPSGAMALIDLVVELAGGTEYRALSVIGSRGAAYADDYANTQLGYRASGIEAFRSDERRRELAAMAKAFLDESPDRAAQRSAAERWLRLIAWPVRFADSARGVLGNDGGTP